MGSRFTPPTPEIVYVLPAISEMCAMTSNFKELDFAQTELGELILRRRRVPSLDGAEIYEVKLDGDFLMSSLVNDSEVALADLGLKALDADNLDVVVGGLGLGCTADATLHDERVRRVRVIEYLPPVIDWHRRSLVPLGETLTQDSRCELVEGDFFDLAFKKKLAGPETGGHVHAILLDIDHSPRTFLHPRHGRFYETEGLQGLAEQLHPGGVFALWSADPPEQPFQKTLGRVFDHVEAHTVRFFNPLINREDTNAVYVARR